MPDRADESCQGACGGDVAGIEDAFPPGPVHDAVGREDADRRCGRSNPRRKQQRSQDAWKRSEVDLLLGADLDGNLSAGSTAMVQAGINAQPHGGTRVKATLTAAAAPRPMPARG